MPVPCLYPACTLPVPCLYPACTLPVPCLYPACTLPVPCLYPAWSTSSLPVWTLYPACTLRGPCTCGVLCVVPCLYPACTLPVPCLYPACTLSSLRTLYPARTLHGPCLYLACALPVVALYPSSGLHLCGPVPVHPRTPNLVTQAGSFWTLVSSPRQHPGSTQSPFPRAPKGAAPAGRPTHPSTPTNPRGQAP